MGVEKVNIVVTGASGYVGSTVLRALTEAGHGVKGIARHADKSAPAGVRWALGDIRDMDLVEPFRGADAVIHLIGIIREIPAQKVTFEAMHVGSTQRVLAAMNTLGIPRLIQMSALGTRPRAVSQYHRTKWEAEQLVRATSHLKATILRPSLIFGGHAPFFDMLGSLAKLPMVPVPGDGNTLFQPVYRGDVAALICALLEDSGTAGKTMEIGGPDRYTLNQLFDFMGAQAGRPHPPKMHLPLGFVGAVARLSNVLPVPVTPDQLAMLTEPNITDDDQWHQWVDQPTTLASGHKK